jgi:hypothetical protein
MEEITPDYRRIIKNTHDLMSTLLREVGEIKAMLKAKPSVARKPRNNDKAKADVIALADEVRRREENNEDRLPFVKGGYFAFGWNLRRSRAAADKAIEMGLLKKIKAGKYGGFHLATTDKYREYQEAQK